MFKINKFSNEHNERAMSMTSAYQKFNNLEPQFPVFQIELVNSKRFKNLLNINIFTDWTQWADNKNDFRGTKVYDLEPQASIFQIELVNSKRFKLCSKLKKITNEHNERAMSMTSAYQKFNNLEPQFPVFQIELVNSERFKNLLNINIFTDWTQWTDNKNDFRVTKA